MPAYKVHVSAFKEFVGSVTVEAGNATAAAAEAQRLANHSCGEIGDWVETDSLLSPRPNAVFNAADVMVWEMGKDYET